MEDYVDVGEFVSQFFFGLYVEWYFGLVVVVKYQFGSYEGFGVGLWVNFVFMMVVWVVSVGVVLVMYEVRSGF